MDPAHFCNCQYRPPQGLALRGAAALRAASVISGISYVPLDGEMVSVAHARALMDMREDGVPSRVSSGHRTFGQQQYFYDCYLCRLRGNTGCCNSGNLAARPSNDAPHIWTGRANHALDFTFPDEAVAWYQRHGFQPSRPVSSENWHVVVANGPLVNYDPRSRLAKRVDALPAHIEADVEKLLFHRRGVIAETAAGGCGPRCDAHKRWRAFYRGEVIEHLRRLQARRPRTDKLNGQIDVLQAVLRDTDGEI